MIGSATWACIFILGKGSFWVERVEVWGRYQRLGSIFVVEMTNLIPTVSAALHLRR